jgi:Uma2 family endonuclease
MAGTPQKKSPPMTVDLFRAFYATRPDEERWELIDGAALMMTPPTPAHQRIASNLERLLNDVFESRGLPLAAYQRLGVDLGPPVEHYDPEPDVIVVDADVGRETDKRYMDRFYLAAEVVSASDRIAVESKREIYKLHPHCNCILTVQQDRCEVRIDRRTRGWEEQVLNQLDDLLVLPDFGLRCEVSSLYRGTTIRAR